LVSGDQGGSDVVGRRGSVRGVAATRSGGGREHLTEQAIDAQPSDARREYLTKLRPLLERAAEDMNDDAVTELVVLRIPFRAGFEAGSRTRWGDLRPTGGGATGLHSACIEACRTEYAGDPRAEAICETICEIVWPPDLL
jgi:hypothetical protein